MIQYGRYTVSRAFTVPAQWVVFKPDEPAYIGRIFDNLPQAGRCASLLAEQDDKAGRP